MCDHPKVLAGHLPSRDRKQAALGYYCAICNAVTYEARGKSPLTLSRAGDPDVRERSIRAWLDAP